MENQIDKWGIYYMPTKEGALFAGLKPELIDSKECQLEAISYCDHLNMAGSLDELHSGYKVKPIYKK